MTPKLRFGASRIQILQDRRYNLISNEIPWLCVDGVKTIICLESIAVGPVCYGVYFVTNKAVLRSTNIKMLMQWGVFFIGAISKSPDGVKMTVYVDRLISGFKQRIILFRYWTFYMRRLLMVWLQCSHFLKEIFRFRCFSPTIKDLVSAFEGTIWLRLTTSCAFDTSMPSPV